MTDAAQTAQPAAREIVADIRETTGPVDRFFDLSVGSDYPGTLIREDTQAQLKTAVDELGFRYIRFHAIFHDVLGTVRVENGKTVYDWTKVDQLYDDLLARHIKPFVELGFTPKALATSSNSIFYWNGNTSHPKPEGWQLSLIHIYVHSALLDEHVVPLRRHRQRSRHLGWDAQGYSPRRVWVR